VPVHRLAAPIEASVDPIAGQIEPLRGCIVTGRRRSIRRTVETPVRAVAAPIQTILDPVAALIETLLDAISPPIGTRRGIRPHLRRAHEQPYTEPYCCRFHRWPPLPRIAESHGEQRLARRMVDERAARDAAYVR
jgi:hypothetical protein